VIAATTAAAVTPSRVSMSSKLVQDFTGHGSSATSAIESEAHGTEPWGLAAVAAAVGTYELDGEAHGFPKYKQIYASATGAGNNGTTSAATSAAAAAASHCNNSRRSNNDRNTAGVEVNPERGVVEGPEGSWPDECAQQEENTLYLYRSVAGRWTVARGPARVKASKGHVVSTLAGGSPVGLDYCYFNGIGGAWPLDPTFTVTANASVGFLGSSLRREGHDVDGGLSAESGNPGASRAA